MEKNTLVLKDKVAIKEGQVLQDDVVIDTTEAVSAMAGNREEVKNSG